MIWIMLATLVVAFVVGSRVLTSESRRAIRRLSERLNTDVASIGSIIDQMGKVQGRASLQYLNRPDELYLQNVAQVLLIWQIVTVGDSEQNLLQQHCWLQKARPAAPVTGAQVRLVLGFLRGTGSDMQEFSAFQTRYNVFFQPEDGARWLH